ncbi:hydantoinase/oxoprolinase family protein [Sandaracinobacteroides saxicola]|uniref:Hydantoinase/oxoprolinase family protein n=1 Tax=Sandaracinobacteroides saxicola TaxID=2759707 RepID=A0A7G5IK90_9SPHN|nr:hydantoinase/oxoprolinase family protein [Sandaracinobacteroides saxicola]QMW23782.1 hydantoinase/oxoprolinase family protein [Sandaracinobacteroides saxicola]
MTRGFRVGVDIGGTFTDVAVEQGSRRWSVKVPTTHDAPDDAVMEAVARAMAQCGGSFAEIDFLVHGTTLATNALIERKGARTALLTTAGFRDVLEMGTEGRFDQYDLKIVKPTPLVPRHWRFGVGERLYADGSVLEPLDEAGVEAAADAMSAEGVEAVAIAFLHAYANGAHELRAAEILRYRLGGDVPLSLGHDVSPEMREYERVSTTCANAYLQPVVSAYLLRLERRLQAAGLVVPMLVILSSGSLTTVDAASRFPVRLLESGPAGGAIFACDIARRLGEDRVLSFDVGGTTAKFCMIDKGEAHHALTFEVGRTYRFKRGSGLPVRVPVVDLVEIGAGGGSIARIDAVGRVAVGPESAGSEPGPACYGRGGVQATVSDCDLLLGKLDADSFAGGTMPLDRAAAAQAIITDVAGPAGLSPEAAAYAVIETVAETMASAARVHAAEIGVDVEARTLIAFGGGAPLQAVRFAEKLGIREIIIPAGAGVGSALGFLRAPLAFEIVRTARLLLPGARIEPVRAALAEMEAAAATIVRSVVRGEPDLAVERTAYMRYRGQGHEIAVALPGHPDDSDFAERLRAAFDSAYQRLHGQALADSPAEVTSWVVRVRHRDDTRAAAPRATTPDAAIADAARRIYDGRDECWATWPEYSRETLAPGATASGPAIITEAETTTVVNPGYRFTIDGWGYIRISRETWA